MDNELEAGIACGVYGDSRVRGRNRLRRALTGCCIITIPGLQRNLGVIAQILQGDSWGLP